MNVRSFPAALATVAVFAAQTARGELVQVKAVRHYSLKEATRVVIEVNSEFQYHTDRLHNPERVFFDILKSRPHVESRVMLNRDLDDKFLKRIRVAETLPGVTRVVLDLQGDAEVTTSQLATPYRLVVELRAKDATVIPTTRVPDAGPSPAEPPAAPFVIKPEAPRVEPPKPTAVTGKTVARNQPVAEPSKGLEEVKTSQPAAPPSKPAVLVTPGVVQVGTLKPADGPGSVLTANRISATDTGSGPAGTVANESSIGKPPVQAGRTEIAGVKPGDHPTAPVLKSDVPAAPGNLPVGAPGKAARPTTSNGNNSLIRALGLKVTRVVLDPGHGGSDQGTVGPKGLMEKELVLDVSKRLGKLIEERMGAEVIYTRTDDTFIPLEGRTALANEKKADLFLSIHANSSPVPRIAGVETFYLNFTDSKDALDVASRENASSQKSIFELRDIISKITLHDKAEESREFASRIQASLFTFSARSGIASASKNRGVKKAPFVVLIGATMPSVLAEIGFLSNAREEANLKRSDYRQKLADALFRGLSKYAESLSHFQVATAKEVR